MVKEKKTTEELLAGYREAAARTAHLKTRVAKSSADHLQTYYQQLCDTPEGRAGITALTEDESPHVRTWAAAHSLSWDVENARTTLDALQESGGPCAFDAERILRQFDKGDLSFKS